MLPRYLAPLLFIDRHNRNTRSADYSQYDPITVLLLATDLLKSIRLLACLVCSAAADNNVVYFPAAALVHNQLFVSYGKLPSCSQPSASYKRWLLHFYTQSSLHLACSSRKYINTYTGVSYVDKQPQHRLPFIFAENKIANTMKYIHIAIRTIPWFQVKSSRMYYSHSRFRQHVSEI